MVALRRLQITRGVVQVEPFDLLDPYGRPFTSDALVGATATFLVRLTASGSNVLSLTPAISLLESKLTVTIGSGDTSPLTLGSYLYQSQLTLADGSVYSVADWSPFDLVLGGSADVTPPTFDATVKLNHDYMGAGELRYVTAGGSPIADAQIRVYLKSQYDAGNLATPVGISATDADGKWLQTLLVAPGYDYVVRFEKPYEFGPDVRVVTVV
jgi:hypothetical protein